MSKQLVKKEASAAAIYDANDLGDWGTNEQFTSNDIVIPQLILLQKGATLLDERDDLKAGDIIHSITKEKMENVSFVPFWMKKEWRNTIKEGVEYKFHSWEPLVDETIDREFLLEGKEAKRQLAYKFYVTVEGYEVPFLITMRGMSHLAGKNLANEMYAVNPAKKLPPPGRTFTLTSVDTTYESKTYKCFSFKEHGLTERDRVVALLEWFKLVNQGKAKEHTGAEVEDVIDAETTKSYAEGVEVNGQF